MDFISLYIKAKKESKVVPLHAVKTYTGSGGKSPLILNRRTTLKWVVTPWPVYPQSTAHRTHWIGGWVGPKAGLDARWRSNVLPLSGPEPRTPATFQHLTNSELGTCRSVSYRKLTKKTHHKFCWVLCSAHSSCACFCLFCHRMWPRSLTSARRVI
jgi:hypothetical protein